VSLVRQAAIGMVATFRFASVCLNEADDLHVGISRGIRS